MNDLQFSDPLNLAQIIMKIHEIVPTQSLGAYVNHARQAESEYEARFGQ